MELNFSEANMRLRFFTIFWLSLVVVLGCAQADVMTSADAILLSGPSAAQSGPFTSSSAMVDANDFANAIINPAIGTMGVQAVSSPTNRADASATHTDTWYCAIGGGCGTLPVSVALGVFLEGSASLGPTNDAHLEANYSIGTTEDFRFVFDQADGGFGASASYTDTNGTINIPVTVVVNGNGTVDFSLNFSTTHAVFPSMCNAPCLTSTGDVQNLNAFTNGGSVDAFHTFGVTITSLDPSIQLISADGRTGGTGTAPVPEPGTLTLLGTGLAGIVVRSRFKRK